MRKITLKIIDKIAKKNGTNIIELFIIFFSNIVTKDKSYEEIIRELNLKDNEFLRDFFDYLSKDIFNEKENFVENLCFFVDNYKKAAISLASFFTIFLSEDVIFSKDVNKIKKNLNNYPAEIKESILKALEFLSMMLVELDDDIRCEIFKNVLNIIIILGGLVKIMDN